IFVAKCARCSLPLRPSDFVFRCAQNTYHTHCFQCVYCSRLLKKGDQYFFVDGQIVCQHDYNTMFLCTHLPPVAVDLPYPPVTPMTSFYDMDPHHGPPMQHPQHHNDNGKKAPKRPRTILNAQQRKAFKFAFEKGPKPSRKVREQLAKDTGLSVRVVQVWFQNQRAKMKKEQRKRDGGKLNSGSQPMSTDSEGKSIAGDDDPKSPLDSVKSQDSDLEDFDGDHEGSGRSSANAGGHHSSLRNREKSARNSGSPDENDNSNPIEKLY
ncbi:LIM homeobox transcription factor 1-beta-like, partial [Aphelenchoides avenae]